jgi:hypothetical protein
MTPREVATARCQGPTAFRRRWYRSLAYALAATPSPAGVVFEATHAEPVPRLTVRPRELIETVRAGPFGASVPLEEGAVPPASEPPVGWIGQLLAVVPAPPPARWPWSRPTVLGAGTSMDRLVGGDGWASFQTFWVRHRTGEIAVARRIRIAAVERERLEVLAATIAAGSAAEWADATGVPSGVRRLGAGALRDWRRGGTRSLPRDGWLLRTPETVDRTAEVRLATPAVEGLAPEHTIVFGASGAGKTSYLAHRAGEVIRRGGRVVVIDLHGDLAPAIVASLPVLERERIVAVDATDRPVPGIAALVAGGSEEERAAAQLVAALKRLTPDGTDLYWGFRLERIFDTFVRLVQESGGSLLDLYGLLTDANRRDAARLATRRGDLASFLEELGPVLRRNPEFLWSAATRLSKVVLVPALGELLAPSSGGLDAEGLIRTGRSLIVRLPIADLGPEAASFAAALVLGRLYLGLVARAPEVVDGPPVWLVLDEVHGFPPRLIAEILTEGRKFGVSALIATQYPERLVPETRNAAAGALTTCVAFRVPRPTSRDVGSWLGLSPADAVELLPHLPTGQAVAVDPDGGGVLLLPRVLPASGRDLEPWRYATGRTRAQFPESAATDIPSSEAAATTERILLAVLGAEEEGRPLEASAVVAAAGAIGDPVDLAALADRWRTTVRRGWVDLSERGCRISAAGEAVLGVGTATGATRESAEHRALLIRAFRIFARRGCRLEIVRQGRYDTTLPDARFRQIAPGARGSAPVELAGTLDRARKGWAWKYFGGRDVEVEAEVSGALRSDRIRHGWQKAEARGAFALFLVGDAARARRVRSTLRALGVGPYRARVWTLPTGIAPRRPPGNP